MLHGTVKPKGYPLVGRRRSIFATIILSISLHGEQPLRHPRSDPTDPSNRYSLAFATSIMLWMVVKKPARGTSSRVRRSIEW